jgi:hypothetical protein
MNKEMPDVKKSFTEQFRECGRNGVRKEIVVKGIGDSGYFSLCTKHMEQCRSEVCRKERSE